MTLDEIVSLWAGHDGSSFTAIVYPTVKDARFAASCIERLPGDHRRTSVGLFRSPHTSLGESKSLVVIPWGPFTPDRLKGIKASRVQLVAVGFPHGEPKELFEVYYANLRQSPGSSLVIM